MDTYRKRSITTLRIAGAMLFALCFATETLAQEISTAINDASATSTIAVTEIAATTIEVPDTETPPNTVEELANGLNTVWMMLAAMLVFFMQPGFALVEAGFTRVKNTANILMKNFVDFMFGSLLYWSAQADSSGYHTSSTFHSMMAEDCHPKAFWCSRRYFVPQQPPSFRELWRNVPSSPCTSSTQSSSVY